MQYRILIALFGLFSSYSALACSPPNGDPRLSNAEIRASTNESINQSDAIVDGIVIQRNDGAVFLKPIKVWKGTPLSLYYIANSGCGIALAAGTKVRALLERVASVWVMYAPLLDDRFDTHLYDSIVDAHLGNVRPSDFENGQLPIEPPPTPRR